MGVAGILVGAVAAGNGWRVDLQTFNTRLETVMAYPAPYGGDLRLREAHA
jgi:hypothetical protein